MSKKINRYSPEEEFGLEGETYCKGGPINAHVRGKAATRYANTPPVPDGINADRYKVYGKKDRHG